MVTENTVGHAPGVSYERALQLWGVKRLSEGRENLIFDPDTVRVEMEFNEGFACCGGSDPECYCSFAESPSANVVVTGTTTTGLQFSCCIDSYSFDFAEVLQEIVTAAGGTVIA